MRIGLIGTGTWSKQTYLKYFKSDFAKFQNHNLVSILSRSKKNIEEFPQVNFYTNFKNMLDKENLDTVCIVSPDNTHFSYLKECMENNIDVIVEKPLLTNVNELNEFLKLKQKSKSKIFVQFHKRFDQSITLLKSKLNIDDIISINLKLFNSKNILENFFSSKEQLLSGPLDFLGSHLIDIIFYIFETKDVEYVQNSLVHIDKKYYKFTIKVKNSKIVNIETGWILPSNFPSITMQEIEVFSNSQYFKLDGTNRGFKISDENSFKFLNPYFQNKFNEGYGFSCLYNSLNYLNNPVNDSRLTDINDAIKNVQIIDKIKKDEDKIHS